MNYSFIKLIHSKQIKTFEGIFLPKLINVIKGLEANSQLSAHLLNVLLLDGEGKILIDIIYKKTPIDIDILSNLVFALRSFAGKGEERFFRYMEFKRLNFSFTFIDDLNIVFVTDTEIGV